MRYLFEFRDSKLIEPPIDLQSGTRTDAADIVTYLSSSATADALDVDDNDDLDPLTDGLLIVRYLLGYVGDDLVAGAVAADCTRCTATDIEDYLNQLD